MYSVHRHSRIISKTKKYYSNTFKKKGKQNNEKATRQRNAENNKQSKAHERSTSIHYVNIFQDNDHISYEANILMQTKQHKLE